MSTPSNLSEQVLATPSGAGAVRSAGETFQADPYAGTGRFAVPIAVNPGPAGIQPALSLSYSTHGGNGAAGLGWSLGLAAVTRRTDRGIPVFDDDVDTFALQGDELLPVGGGYYRQRTESRFARIRHVQSNGREFWVVTERDGTRVFYGEQPDHRLHRGSSRISTWFVSRKQDVHGNEVTYHYDRDPKTHDVRLSEVLWAGCYRVVFAWEERPDPIESQRAGLPHTATHRLAKVSVEVKKKTGGAWHAYREYVLGYLRSSWTGRSLLTSVTVTGRAADNSTRTLPRLKFTYVEPTLGQVAWHQVSGGAGSSLGSGNVTLVRQSGSGLPDLLETRETGHYLHVNVGQARFEAPRLVASPAQVQLEDAGTFISDMDGDGWGDLVVGGGARTYRGGVPGGGWGAPYTSSAKPSFDLDDPNVRLADLTGNGLPDALHTAHGGWWFYENLGNGQWGSPVRVLRPPAVQFDDPRVHLVDISGDGLADVVYMDGQTIRVWPSLGRGQFGDPYRLKNAPVFGARFDPAHARWSDLTGSGQADLLHVDDGTVRVFLNQADGSLADGFELAAARQSSEGHVETVDLLGTGAEGLLFTDKRLGPTAWRFLEVFPSGSPDLLSGIDNGMGGSTTLSYTSSAAHWVADRAAGKPWQTSMPSAQRVVDRVVSTDLTTGLTLGVQYRYHHGVYDGAEREFRGFGAVEQLDREADPDDPQPLSQVRTHRWYHTGADVDLRAEFAPLPRGIAAPDEIPPLRWARRALRGQVHRQEVYALDGNPSPYQVTETAYRVFPVQRTPGTQRYSFIPLPVHQRTTTTERGPAVWARVLDTTTTYDLHTGRGYGLPVEVREKGFGRFGTYSTAHEQQQTDDLERYTKTTYVSLEEPEPSSYSGSYTPAYVVGKPSVVEVWAVEAGGDELLSKIRTFYDGDDYEGLGHPDAASEPGVTHGLVSSVLTLGLTDTLIDDVYPAGAGDAAALSARGNYLTDGTEHYIQSQRSKYSASGMLEGSRSPSDSDTTQSTVTYDSTYGLFAEEVVDSLEHPTTVTRGELWFQVGEIIDANGNTTSFTYDPSGLPMSKAVQGKEVASVWTGDPPTSPTEQWEYDFDVVPIQVITKTRQVREGATLDVYRYLDGLGNTLQERHDAEPDPATPSTPRFRVTGWQVRNHKGLVVYAYQPTFSTSSDYATGDQTVPFIETTYDPLGRPVRVDHPDDTYETTTYDPWVREHRDRNDNAGGITGADPLYGDYLNRFSDHVDTPTRTYVDALGRDIAIEEDTGDEPAITETIRVTTYELGSSDFTGTSYNLTLSHPLKPNYFVMIDGSPNVFWVDPDNLGVRVSADPFGTGALGTSSDEVTLTLIREGSGQGAWLGTVTVVECLGDPGAAGFSLVDVVQITASSTASAGYQTTTDTSSTAWSDLDQIALYGGLGGGGATDAGTVTAHVPSLVGKLTPSSTNTITLKRHGGNQTLDEVEFLVYVVEWGSEHTIQRVTVNQNNGGPGIDATSEYATATISQVTRANTWCWISGLSANAPSGPSFLGIAVALGDGVNQNATETSVAVGAHYSTTRDVLVTVHSHPDLAVDWRFISNGNSTSLTVTQTVDGLDEPLDEEYDESSSPKTTEGARFGRATSSLEAVSGTYERTIHRVRHTAETSADVDRSSQGNNFAAWVQSVDASAITHATRRTHVTRSVLDLKDQVVEVHDARELGSATWEFTYDFAGRRIQTDHTTGAGVRYALPDAAGSPIWSRDARAIEVDRTFDVLSRPLDEKTGGTVLRRAWKYINYDEQHADFSTYKSKNLFGQIEEARDADGLRFFEYDHRGLVTKASHRFWDQDWTNNSANIWTRGSSWDPAVPSTDRNSVSSWLSLQHLTSTTTIEITTTHDAAGRPTEVTYPEGMKVDRTYNEAGLVDRVRVDRGTGSGWEDVIDATEYNARGQLTHYEHGNGIHTDHTYDSDLDRLTRIHTWNDSTSIDYQKLDYFYDPVGNPVEIEDLLTNPTYAANKPIPNTRTFYYDGRYRLIRATGTKLKTVSEKSVNPYEPAPASGDYEAYDYTYRYDEVGNFTKNHEYSRGQIHYKSGRIDLFNGDGKEALDSGPDEGNFIYDANGNTTKTPRQTELAYTHDNQARYVDMGGGTEVRYMRHADQRVVRFVKKNGVNALGVYLGPWEYHERQGTGARTKAVLHVEAYNRHAQAEVLLDGTDSSLVDLFFHHSDHLGSGHILTASDGTLLSQEEYFPYGRASDRRDERNRYRFIGVERDEDTGLCLTGPRCLDPLSGRFLQADPWSPVEQTPYAYASSQPLLRVDFDGYAEPDASRGEQGKQPEEQDAREWTPEEAFNNPTEFFDDTLGISESAERAKDWVNQQWQDTLDSVRQTAGDEAANALESGVQMIPFLAPGDEISLYHGTTSNKASKIVGNEYYEQQGLRGTTYFAESRDTALALARVGAADVAPGETEAKKVTVIEFKVPRVLAEHMRLTHEHRKPITGIDEDLPHLDIGSGYERVLDISYVNMFNERLASGEITYNRYYYEK